MAGPSRCSKTWRRVFLRVDGMNGFTVPALARARDAALAKVKANGCAVLAIRNSHHLGALSLDVEPFADEGLIALSFINSMASVVPHGGRKAALGTNPIAFATPRRDARPLVFDMATSVMAHGDVQLAAREGRILDEGVGVDRDGNPTNDPRGHCRWRCADGLRRPQGRGARADGGGDVRRARRRQVLPRGRSQAASGRPHPAYRSILHPDRPRRPDAAPCRPSSIGSRI